MRHLFGIVLLAALAASLPAGSARTACSALAFGPGPLDVERTAAAFQCGMDPAAHLTATQRYALALDALRGSDDSLRMGIIACYAQDYSRAAQLLRCRVRDPYLDWFRGYYRAFALRRTADYRGAAAELDSVLSDTGSARLAKSSASVLSARALEIDVTLRDDSLFALRGIPGNAAPRSPRELLALASGLADRGLDSLAAVSLVALTGKLPAGTETETLRGIFARIAPLNPRLSSPQLRALAQTALAKGLDVTAEAIIRELLERDAGASQTLFLKAQLLALRGKKREAIALCDGIAAADVPEKERAAALEQSASLEYRLGNAERAVERYRRLGAMKGQGESLDLAARICVTLGRHEEAVALWKQYVAVHVGNPDTGTRRGGSTRPATLLHWLGRDPEAYALLKPAGRDITATPGQLYWLARTCPSDSLRALWSSELSRSYPRSFYTFALAHELDSLPARGAPNAFSSRIDSMVAGERRLVDSLASAVSLRGESAGKPGFAASRYFLDRGLLSEAGECMAALGAAGTIDTLQVLDWYLAARALGFYDVAIRLVNGSYRTSVPRRLVERLSHPVAFPALLADRQTTAGLPPELVLAVMYAESKFGVSAVSSSSAMGVMQLMPSTARWAAQRHGLPRECAENLLDPECNIRIATRYLAYLLERSDGSLVGALAAYNAGWGKMKPWQEMFQPAGDPMIGLELIGPSETNAYVKEVLDALRYYRALSEGKEARP